MTHYFTIEKQTTAEFKDRGSKFIAYAFPISTVDDHKKELKAIKEAHPKAAHYCYAYRLGTDGTTFRANDDGEPAGSAGKPILGQLDSKQVTNTAIVVVRYFGGTLLGVPGLITAYKTAASFALQLTPIVQKPVLITYRLQFDYTIMNEVMLHIKRNNGVVFKNEMQLFCLLEVGIPKEQQDVFTDQMAQIHSVDIVKLTT